MVLEEARRLIPVPIDRLKATTSVAVAAVVTALWLAARYRDDYRRAILEAINAGGDTDTVAAIVGAVVGASVGLSGIPAEWRAELIGRPLVLQFADQLAGGPPPEAEIDLVAWETRWTRIEALARQNGRKVRQARERMTAVTMGSHTLDVLVTGQTAYPMAGGTAGNVAARLAANGWHVYPLARLDPGPASEAMLADLQRFGVRPDYTTLGPRVGAPLVLQTRNPGEPPSFSTGLPCGHYPRPPVAVDPMCAAEILGRLLPVRVVFFDRPTEAALIVAGAAQRQNALVVFEPSFAPDDPTAPSLWRDAVNLADVVKVSRQRVPEPVAHDGLLIQTMDSEGVRYRRGSGEWRTVPAVAARIPPDADTVGAGDAFTAAFLNAAGSGGRRDFLDLNAVQLLRAIEHAALAGAHACLFESARGDMYPNGLPDPQDAAMLLRSLCTRCAENTGL